MGLDGVELVMAVEEEFGIAIDDRDAEQIVTVGQLWEYICERVDFQATTTCATAAAFYRLRRAFVSLAVVPRSRFQTDSQMDGMLPSQDRRKFWTKLSETTGFRLPALELSARLDHLRLTLAILAPAAFATILVWNGLIPHAIAAFVVGFVVGAILIDWLIVPWRTQLNPAWATAGGLARTVVGLNPNVWNVPATQSREIAWERLRAIIIETLGVSADLVRPEACFVKDLGMD